VDADHAAGPEDGLERQGVDGVAGGQEVARGVEVGAGVSREVAFGQIEQVAAFEGHGLMD